MVIIPILFSFLDFNRPCQYILFPHSYKLCTNFSVFGDTVLKFNVKLSRKYLSLKLARKYEMIFQFFEKNGLGKPITIFAFKFPVHHNFALFHITWLSANHFGQKKPCDVKNPKQSGAVCTKFKGATMCYSHPRFHSSKD